MVMSEVDDSGRENTPLVSGRAVSNTSCAGSSGHSGVYFYAKGRGPFGESLADAPATSDSFLHGPDQQFAALRAREAKRLAEHIPGQLRVTVLKGRMRAEERRSKNTAQTGLVSEEDEPDIALHVEEENTLDKHCRWTLRRQSRCQPGRCKTSRHRQRRRRKCVDDHFVRRLSTLRRLSSMDYLT